MGEMRTITKVEFDQMVSNVAIEEKKNCNESPTTQAQSIFLRLVKLKIYNCFDSMSMIEINAAINKPTLKNDSINFEAFIHFVNELSNILTNSLFYGDIKRKELTTILEDITKKHINLPSRALFQFMNSHHLENFMLSSPIIQDNPSISPQTNLKKDKIRSVKNTYASDSKPNSRTIKNIDNRLSKVISQFHSHLQIGSPVIYYRTINSSISIVTNYFQIGPRDIKNTLYMSIVQILWGNMFYYFLKNQETADQVISANKQTIDSTLYFTFSVSGSKVDPQKFNLEIDKVIINLGSKLDDLSNVKFKEVKGVIRSEIKRKNVSLLQKSEEVWNEIYENTKDFRRNAQLLSELDSITIQEIKSFYNLVFISEPKKLSIQLFAANSEYSPTYDKVEYYYLNSNLSVDVTEDLDFFSNQETISTSSNTT